MFDIIKAKKKIGQTNLEFLNQIKSGFFYNFFFKGQKLTYLSRLDPMASGICYFLKGKNENLKKEYLKKNKIYKFKVLWGLKTDTLDLLGLIISKDNSLILENINQNFLNHFNDLLKKEIKVSRGIRMIELPTYSSPNLSKTGQIKGKKLLMKQITIFDFLFKKSYFVSGKDLNNIIIFKLNLVKNQNYRNLEIIEGWSSFFDIENQRKFFIISEFQISCSSGTYVRKIIDDLSKLGLAFEIERVKIF